MTIAEIKLDLTMAEFNDAQAEQLIDAMDAVDWATVAREAIREAMYVTASDPALVDMDTVLITKIEEDLF